ncbi:hypothetical protein, partial [Gelidibacter salicanalis]|uniref:hypothetical protein n=1 Tax=Gelidibacter salicanalis TaxID=291193 RepID=UPI001F3C7616
MDFIVQGSSVIDFKWPIEGHRTYFIIQQVRTYLNSVFVKMNVGHDLMISLKIPATSLPVKIRMNSCLIQALGLPSENKEHHTWEIQP